MQKLRYPCAPDAAWRKEPEKARKVRLLAHRSRNLRILCDSICRSCSVRSSPDIESVSKLGACPNSRRILAYSSHMAVFSTESVVRGESNRGNHPEDRIPRVAWKVGMARNHTYRDSESRLEHRGEVIPNPRPLFPHIVSFGAKAGGEFPASRSKQSARPMPRHPSLRISGIG